MGGLIGNLGLFPFMNRLDLYDLNNMNLGSGIYGLNNTNNDNSPSNNNSGIILGTVIIFNGNGLSGGGNPIVQIIIEYTGVRTKYRTNWVGNWNDWKQI